MSKKYVRTALDVETHAELKKQCAINNVSMQDFVADLIATNLNSNDLLARRLSKCSKEELEEILKTAQQIRNNNN